MGLCWFTRRRKVHVQMCFATAVFRDIMQSFGALLESAQNFIVLQQEAKAQTYFPVASDIHTQWMVAPI